jgi:ADP-ribose pyrophosphatase YjhB (NUDIX family)
MEPENAGILVADEYNVLLAKRNTKPGVRFPGYWSPFAGAIEEGETPREAAVRELFEESEIKAEGRIEFLGKIKRGGYGLFFLFLYRVKGIPYPRIDSEHTEWGIFKMKSILSSPNPMDPWIVEEISKIS